MIGYDFHPEARLDVDDIWEFIAADNLAAADRLTSEVLGTIRALVHFPHQGHRRPDLTSRPLRFISVREYLIAYTPDEKPLWIIAVNAWTPQPAGDGGDPQGQRIKLFPAIYRAPRITTSLQATPGSYAEVEIPFL